MFSNVCGAACFTTRSSCWEFRGEVGPKVSLGWDVFGVYDGGRLLREGMMARKSRLARVAVGIGSAIGRADRKAHQVAKAGLVAKKELDDISKQVEVLKRQLQKAAKRLKRALR